MRNAVLWTSAVLAFLVVGCSSGKTSLPGELSLPVEVTSKPAAKEVARIWTDGEHQTVILAPQDKWGAEEWGIMMADFARHVAKMKSLNKKADEEKFLKLMREMFEAEMDHPTDTPTGHLGD
jgi:hypothetical protein